ncbi:hypothetical protein KUTeg_010239 [Tegillarca granosa]|uniref:Myb-binding protein 1A n=1 Tax=Tegillarca granosa TaxID=220873 RepID=A0ABQ9F9G8_TEGGR|nr:hypothetical protein KUTeg_010239 [Tegillarca granosa]
MDMKQEKSSHNALKVDQNVLDSFWVLAESNKKNINETTKGLVNVLMSKQKTKASEEMEGDLKYSVNRLVKGLASSRESARQGYSVALCQILRTFEVVTVKDIMDCVEKHLKYTNNMSKSEKGSIFLGKTLVYLSLIKSGLLKKASHKEIKTVVKQLRQMYRKKSYLQQICTSALVLCIQQVDEEVFKESIWPEVESDMKQGWDSCTPDNLMLLMTCRKCQSAMVNKKFLKEHWGSSKIICENNYPHLSRIIADSCSCYPVIHLVVDDIIREVTNKTESPLETFWKHCTSDLFGKHQTREINTGMYVLAQLVPLIKSADDVESLFSSSVMSTMMRNSNTKFKATNPLYQAAVNVMNKLTEFVKLPTTEGDVQMAIIRLLWEDQGRQYITKHIDNMIQNLSPEGAKALGQYMMKSFSDGISHNKSSSEPQEPGKLWDIVSEIRTLVTIPSTITDHQWQSELLQFLVLHSFWKVNKPVSTVKYCDKTIEKLDERLQKKFQDNLLKALHNLLIFKTEKSKVSSLNAYIDTVHSLVQYVKTLLEHGEEIVPVPKISKEVLESWNTAFKLLNDIHEKNASSETSGSGDVNLCRAFELLTMFYMLQLFFDASNSVTVLQDMQICYQKVFPIATKGRKAKKSQGDEEPDWIAVITELLLSMMSQGSSLARMTAKSVFGYLTSHVTPEALGLITDVLKTEKSDNAEDEGQLSFEDDDMDEEMNDEDNAFTEEFGNSLNNDINMSDDEKSDDVDDDSNGANEDDKGDDDSSSSDDEDDSEEEEDVDEEFRKSVKDALGGAAASDEEDEDCR